MRSVTSGDRLAQQFGPRAAIEQGWPSLPARSDHAIWVWCEGKNACGFTGDVFDDEHYREVPADWVDRGFPVSCYADGPAFLEALSNGATREQRCSTGLCRRCRGSNCSAPWRERRIGLPGVFLTGYSLVELELRAMDHGAIDFVDKARGLD